MKIFITIIRTLVGVLFIFSGLVKANDPLGLSYKMQEFFDVWKVYFLNKYTLSFSIAIISFEIVAGIAILLGWQKKIFLWCILLLTLFFAFLTGYAVFSNKIKTCGCFGDCIPLTAKQSFIKDLILFALVLLLLAYKRYLNTLFKAFISMLVLIITLASSLFLQWYVLRHLPIVDCLPYKKGNHLPTLMQPPLGSFSDSSVITFVYTKNGKEIEFTADQFPQDFNDRVYHFEKRYDKLIRKGNAEPVIQDFSLNSSTSGVDSTNEILRYPGNTLILFVENIDDNSLWINDIKELYDLLNRRSGWLFIIASNNTKQVLDLISQKIHVQIPLFNCDATVIKTIARANPTLYLLQQGFVINKWSYVDFNEAIKNIKTSIRKNPS